MNQVDALKMVEHVQSRLVELAVAENYFRERSISEIARSVWSGRGDLGGLVSELWVEGAFAGEVGSDSLKTLAAEGIFPQTLCDHVGTTDVFPLDRLLYNHQSESIRASLRDPQRRPSLVVTAGTGLGKTEAFLLPMLGDLWSAGERQQEGGMRCLILYPMNALVSDQVERLYGWLQGQDEFTVFHFTSETPEDHRIANRRGVPEYYRCRIRTRQEARGFETWDGRPTSSDRPGRVPDVVITNYSMLEYMLCRPQDRRFFGPDLRCIILDEAHLYSGSLAAEIAMLLRRVRERCGVASDNLLQIATSATLGGTPQDLQAFASDIFSVGREQVSVIQGRIAQHHLAEPVGAPSNSEPAVELANHASLDFETKTADEQLVNDGEQTVHALQDLVQHLVADSVVREALETYGASPARFLHSTLQRAPLVRKLARILSDERGNVLSLGELAKRLFPNQPETTGRQATVTLLRLAAAARTETKELPLVPHRLHFLVRAPEGLAVCLSPYCTGPNERILPSVGCLQSYADTCRYCEHAVLPVHRCDNCGDWALAAHENQEQATLQPDYYAESAAHRTYYLLANRGDGDLEEVVVDPLLGEILGHGSQGTRLWKARRAESDSPQLCPTCESEWTISVAESRDPEWRHTCRALVGGRPFALSVTAETVLYDLPEIPGQTRNWKPAKGRRLLCFSDSRASAARLGPLLTQQHEIQVIRAAMSRCVGGLTGSRSSEYLEGEVERLSRQLGDISLDPGLRLHLETELGQKREQLVNARAGTPFVHFSSLVGNRDEIAELLDRESAERHQVRNYAQTDWKRNREAVRSHIEAVVAKELQRPLKRQTSVESTGLIEIVYPGVVNLAPPPVFEERLPSSVRLAVSTAWPSIVTLLLDTVRMDGCVYWSNESPNRMWMNQYLLAGRWLTRNRGGWSARAFVGATVQQLRRSFAKNVLLTSGCASSQADQLSEHLLSAVFDQLYGIGLRGEASWLAYEEHHQTGPNDEDRAIRILADRLSVRGSSALYICESTRTVWTSSAMGWAPIEGCLGTLRPIAEQELDMDPRWGRARREFKNSPILSMGLWAEEHSAQLSPQETRRLQELFKAGIRNVLSSTTTMELGIDIGGLNGVLLSNVPPGPANHRQRAGRAGRRSDGSAIVVTFARDSDYDREVFHRFGDFLRRPLRRPTVFMERVPVIKRHLHAVLLAEYLRGRQPGRTGAMQAFGRMGQFCGVDAVPSYWKNARDPKPHWPDAGIDWASVFSESLGSLMQQDLGYRRRFQSLAAATGLSKVAELGNWRDFVHEARSTFDVAIAEWRRDVNYLRDAWLEIPSTPTVQVGREMAKANSIRYMARTLIDITVIEWLANHRFLPRYGFPINLQSLSVRRPATDSRSTESTADERYKLERSSLLALREYVPESQVLVGGRVATSRGLRKHWTDGNMDQALGLQYFALRCSEDHVFIHQAPDANCPRCGGEPAEREHLVFPRFGYTTAGWEDQPLGTNLERVGEQSVCPTAFAERGDGETTEDFGGLQGVRATYREDAELLVRNAGRNGSGFAICTKCGFSMSEVERGQGRMRLPRGFEQHPSIFSANSGSFCWERNDQNPPILRNRVLAARELTDMVLLEFPGASFASYDAVYSLGRALAMAGARLLELDERELGVEIVPLSESSPGIVVYDVAPGGAGHCPELLVAASEWVVWARSVLFVDEKHDARCRKACLDCILDFSGQYAAQHLDRRAALSLLDDVVAN